MTRILFLSTNLSSEGIEDPLIWHTVLPSAHPIRLLIDPGTTGLRQDGIISLAALRSFPPIPPHALSSPVPLRLADGSTVWTDRAVTLQLPFAMTFVVADLDFGEGVHALVGKAGMVRMIRDHAAKIDWLRNRVV